jgi:phenylpropionate dioxygenase-like ring-hydroxylating dioxygenase large terminal subunit
LAKPARTDVGASSSNEARSHEIVRLILSDNLGTARRGTGQQFWTKPMRQGELNDITSLVRTGAVHRSLYDDPAIFELELDRIFGTAWVYVGHESQVKEPGDYFCTHVGRKPIVIVRGPDKALHALHNQCAHRGALVVALDKGNTDEFQCCYHGWTYHLDGRLKAVPLQHGYPPGFDTKSRSMAMLHVARVSSYRGFIFVNQSAAGPSLEDWLGYMTTSLDDMVDRAPDGEIEVAGGVFKHTYNGNWKLYLENLCDAAHPWFTHRSSIDAAQKQNDEVDTDGAGEIAIRQMRQNGAPYSFWETQVGIWTYPNGHSYLGDYHDDKKLVAALNDPTFRDYIAAMEQKKGKEATKRALEVRRWNSNVYPNLSFMSQFQQLRVIHPLAVDRTLVCTYSFKLRGAPEGMFHNTIRFANVVNGTGSLVLTDDLEIYNRIGLGISSEGAEWLQIGRGYQSDMAIEHNGRRGKNSTSEVYIRNMFDAWLGYMAPAGTSSSRAHPERIPA